MKTSLITLAVVVVLAVLGGWYYLSAYPSTPAAAPMIPYTGATATSAATTTPAEGDGTPVGENLILGLGSQNAVGSYLTAYNGMTVYTYSPDMALMGQTDASACTGACATAWPPYTVASKSDINVSAATTGVVDTTVRADGSLQITYNGMPLYFYAKDQKPGDTNGQGIGGVWYVAKP